MDDRSRLFITRVRKRLGAEYNDLQDEEIYDAGNLYQTQIMIETGGVEKDFTIHFKAGLDHYDILDESAFKLRRISPSWDGSIRLCNNPSEFEEYKNASSNYPVALTIYGDKMYFYPAPASDGDSVLFWMLQREIITPMDDDTPPETPVRYDLALIYGTVAELAPELTDPRTGMAYYQMYRNQLDLMKHRGNNKIAITRQMEDNF